MFIHSDKMIIGADIGGTHITTAILHPSTLEVEAGSIQRLSVDGKSAKAGPILDRFLEAFGNAITALNGRELAGISIAMPGPFDYSNGLFKLSGLDKFNSLFGINFKALLYNHLPISQQTPILLNNDADCFGLGAYQLHLGSDPGKLIGITLGTGFGTSFVNSGVMADAETGVPPEGNLFNQPLSLVTDTDTSELQFDKAENIISARGILHYINTRANTNHQDLATIAKLAVQEENPLFITAFKTFGQALGTCLAPWIGAFRPDKLVIGGGITGAADLFMPAFQKALPVRSNSPLKIEITNETDMTTIVGAAYALRQLLQNQSGQTGIIQWRKTHQPLLPQQVKPDMANADEYQIYPFTALEAGQIYNGFDGLAKWLLDQKNDQQIIAIDGFIGTAWPLLQQQLAESLSQIDVRPLWIDMAAFLKPEHAIDDIVQPFLGADGAVWGKATDLQLSDFFETEIIAEQLSAGNIAARSRKTDLVIVYGIGAGLAASQAPVIYVDLPRNEVQYRMRAGTATNLGATGIQDYAMMYKRSYFVDWPVLNKHRSAIEDQIAIVVDAQWRESLNWVTYETLCSGFEQMSQEPIRARPWFAPGAWGGDWMQSHIPGLSPEEVNYAWSFELIVPENGLVLESSGHLLEVPFEWLMAYGAKKIIGEDANTFGTYFPIRFDFLDTYHGGNLSIQCHPSLPYIQQHFGEKITQDETYYMLDCEPDAGVYLGFQEDIVPADFQKALETSQKEGQPINIEQYVQFLPAKKHDLFLIPNQTVHSAGINNLVLEISATPYIFTFKMYDWVRPDLNGKPRPINIEHAFHNLDFNRKGQQVQDELCSKPKILESAPGFKRIHLPTHAAHFYDIHRLELEDQKLEATDGKCHILMVVEGSGVRVEIPGDTNHKTYDFAYAETFIIPAAVKEYRLISSSGSAIKIIKSFIK